MQAASVVVTIVWMIVGMIVRIAAGNALCVMTQGV
jgi:hypothetical protein